MSTAEALFFVGVDWATEEHQVCVEDATGTLVAERAVKHSGSALEEFCLWLSELSDNNPQQVWVAIEVPHGAVVETLLEKGFRVFSINPKQMDRFRDRFSVAGAKDDRLDARVLADSLRTDTHHFRDLRVAEPRIIELREWSRMADELGQEHVRLSNRVRDQLRRYYPQALKITDDIGTDWFLDLWDYIPTPAKAQHARASSVNKLLRQRRIRKITATELLAILREPKLTVAPGTTEAAVAHLKLLSARLRLLNAQIRQCHQRLDGIVSELIGDCSPDQNGEGSTGEQRDAAILDSLPGVGPIVLATLLSEASEPLKQRDYHTLRALSGVAPVTRRSGKHCGVAMRRACNPRLREATYHWARVAMQRDPVSRLRYYELRSRGHSHGRALRGLADRLLYVSCAMLKSATLFDPMRRTIRRAQKAA